MIKDEPYTLDNYFRYEGITVPNSHGGNFPAL